MDVAGILRSDMSIADKIRALDAGGLPRAEIARRLGKRYQHVRNVLEGDKLRALAPSGAGGVEERGRDFERGADPEVPPAIRKVRDVQRRGSGGYRLVVREDGS